MNDLVVLIGFFSTAAVVLLASLIVLDRHWGTSALRGLVKPKHPLFYEGRPWWTKGPLLFQILHLPVVAALLAYTLILKPDLLLLHSILLVPIWISASVISLLVEVDCGEKSKGNANSEEHEKKPT